MVTGVLGSTALFNHTQQLSFVRRGFSYVDVPKTMTVGIIPAGSLILPTISGLYLSAAFDGTTVVDVGITGTLEKFASDLATTAVGFNPFDVPTAVFYVTTDTTIIMTTAGTTPTVGTGICAIFFIPNVDN